MRTISQERQSLYVPLGMLRRYLTVSNWRVANRAGAREGARPNTVAARVLLGSGARGSRDFDVYVLSGEDSVGPELIVPQTSDTAEYNRKIERVLRTLADWYGTTPEEMATDVRAIGYDVVRSHIPDRYTVDSSIRLEIAKSYINGIREVLAATATTELNPTPYFLRLKKEATQFADQCRFGHTFRGSFGFAVESPVTPNAEPTLGEIAQSAPFERRVIERLLNGISSTMLAVQSDSLEPLTSSSATGFSANICDQFAELVEMTSLAEIAFEFRLSPEWKSELVDFGEHKTFIIGPRHVEAIREAAKELRDVTQPWPETVLGRVIRLSSDIDPSDLLNVAGEREVAIQWSSEYIGDIVVRTTLSPAEYLRAVEAHASGRIVEVSGTLDKRGRSWILSGATDFHIKDADGASASPQRST